MLQSVIEINSFFLVLSRIKLMNCWQSLNPLFFCCKFLLYNYSSILSLTLTLTLSWLRCIFALAYDLWESIHLSRVLYSSTRHNIPHYLYRALRSRFVLILVWIGVALSLFGNDIFHYTNRLFYSIFWSLLICLLDYHFTLMRRCFI